MSVAYFDLPAPFADPKRINRALFGAYYEEDIYDRACTALPFLARGLWWRMPEAMRWRKLYIVVGYLLIAAFISHSDFSLPDTAFEWALGACFALVTLSGVFGTYLAWSLLLLGRGGVDVATWPSLVDYLARMQARPQVKAAIDHEMELWKKAKT